MAFQAVVRKARFVYSPYTSQEMQGFAQVLADAIKKRIQSGQNIYDQSAAPLKPALAGRRGYPDYKSARGLQPKRDWTWTGHTLSCMRVLSGDDSKAVIGFLDEALAGRQKTANQVAFYNNYREKQWGVSPHDRTIVMSAMAARTHSQPTVSAISIYQSPSWQRPRNSSGVRSYSAPRSNPHYRHPLLLAA
jgi:hypothetical protein